MKEFQFQGINYLALVCQDMDHTVDFYCNTLGLELIKTIELPGGGQHFFFDIGNGDALAFFWFPEAPAVAPGIASVDPNALKTGDIKTAQGSMNHFALQVAPDQLEQYQAQLTAKGVETTPILHHADVPEGYVSQADETTFLSSFYFFDPNGILLEFAAPVRKLGNAEGDAQYPPSMAGN